jgi:hypothetical protein
LGGEEEAPVFEAGGDIISDKGKAVEAVGRAVDVYGEGKDAERGIYLAPAKLGPACEGQ